MINKKLILNLFIFFISSISVYSQISEGGIPPSFKQDSQSFLRTAIPTYSVPVNLDVRTMIWRDSVAGKNGSPLKIAENIPFDFDMKEGGSWSTLNNNVRIWQQSVTADNAVGLIISYKDFYIPKGGKLFIYNADRSQVLGAYTYSTHPQGGSFATEIISGDTFTFEYVASRISQEEPRIVIENLGYIYSQSSLQRIVKSQPLPGINTPANSNGGISCRINVNCPDGKNWQDQKRGSVLLIIPKFGSWGLCSGSLINTTKEDASPYVYTAEHCISDDTDFSRIVTYFNHEFPGCEDETVVPSYKSIVGGEPLAWVPINGGSDSFVYKLSSNVPLEWKPYFNGWDISNMPSTSGVAIHHPNGDVAKIVTYINPVTSSQFQIINEIKGAENASWRVIYDGRSVTESGSSGSPLFNESGLIVGALSGGASYCTALFNPDFYGKLSYAWDQYTMENPNLTPPYGAAYRLKEILDPLNKGVKSINGYDPNGYSGIEEEISVNKNLIIFPNPVKSELNVNSNSIIRNAKVYTINGQLIYSVSEHGASTLQIPSADWTPGIYMIVIQDELGQRKSEKFLKN